MLCLLVSVFIVGLYVWQDGVQASNDGRRYTSGKSQPKPFNRRFCSWDAKTLKIVTYSSLVFMGFMMNDVPRVIILLSLPGAWFIATHPHVVDAPAMALAWTSSMFANTHPYISVIFAGMSGFIHERGPVYAALYSWSPIPLIGLVFVPWWKKAARRDGDLLVGGNIQEVLNRHKPFHDWLSPLHMILIPLRGIVPAMCYFGTSTRAIITLLVSISTFLVGTDPSRYLFWAAPILIVDLPQTPIWFVALHVATFRRSA